MTERSYDTGTSWWHLSVNTFAFTMCFAAWMLNGVLMTFLWDNNVYEWTAAEVGWLLGAPVLTGALFRLPLGIATDKWGGRFVMAALLVFSAIPMYLLSSCDSYWAFMAASVGFGFVGTSFAVGIAGTSVWFSPKRQGLALGIFGAGNAGAALTTLVAPSFLLWLTDDTAHIEAWRTLPKLYAGLLVGTAVFTFVTTRTRLPIGSGSKTLGQRLVPLRSVRVWRFGLYYFFVFGGFVALAQWLVPYYANAYVATIAMAGLLTSITTLPSGVIRALGGWMSDKWGARRVLLWVFGVSFAACAMLLVPQMDIHAPGTGIMAKASGVVVSQTDQRVEVFNKKRDETFVYDLVPQGEDFVTKEERQGGFLVWPRIQAWDEAVVEPGQEVGKKQLVARGITHIFFQANIWIFTFLCFVVGSAMGIGKAAVYRFIPDYFPNDVGVVGGAVGLLGGLGGFVLPVVFGYLLDWTELWTSCWLLFLALLAVCLWWLNSSVSQTLKAKPPEAAGTPNHDEPLSHGARAGRAVARRPAAE